MSCTGPYDVSSCVLGLFSHLPDQSAIEINALTSDSVLYGPVASSQDVQHQITSLYQVKYRVNVLKLQTLSHSTLK